MKWKSSGATPSGSDAKYFAVETSRSYVHGIGTSSVTSREKLGVRTLACPPDEALHGAGHVLRGAERSASASRVSGL